MTLTRMIIGGVGMFLLIVTGCYFIMRTKDQRKQDREQVVTRLARGWNRVVHVVRGHWFTNKTDAELAQGSGEAGAVAAA